MKLAVIRLAGIDRVAFIIGESVYTLTSNSAEAVSVARGTAWMLRQGLDAMRVAEERAHRLGKRTDVARAHLRPPILPGKIIGVGMNYHSFIAAAERSGIAVPKERLWFLRPPQCIAGPADDVWLPRLPSFLDYEVELGIVIGRECRNVTPEEARHAIGGFTIANDLTLRDRIPRSVVLGKSFDTHTPIGPCIVTPDELGDPQGLHLTTWVNGELRQDSNTQEMIADCYTLVSEISSAGTLYPGDLILSGTPDGSGALRRPVIQLQAGDLVRLEIERIGAIENRVIDEPASA